MPPPRLRLTLRRLMVAIALMALPLSAISCVWRVMAGLSLFADPGCSVIHPMGDGLVGAIEAWRSRNGRYPDSLAEAGLTSPTNYHGGFQYERSGTGFLLSVGRADGSNMNHSYQSAGAAAVHGGPGWHCMD